jgi:hypothetical protein
MCGWIYSLVAMNSLRHIQGVAAATRSLFELLLDLNILARDTTDELVERFHNFVEVKRFDTAKKTVNFNNANPSLVNYDDSPQRTLLNTPGKEAHVKNLLLKHWPGHKKCPDHWTGEDTRKRAVGLGPQFEELYVRTYSVLSWYVHPGSVCYAGMDANALENGFGWYHSLSQEFFLNATSVCGRQMKVDVAVGVGDFNTWLQGLRLTPGKVLVQEQIKRLEETIAKRSKSGK